MQRVTRRFFIGAGATALLGSVGSPFGACGATVRRPKPSDRINLAVIGCGTMGRGNMEAFMQDPRVQVVAACDPPRHGAARLRLQSQGPWLGRTHRVQADGGRALQG